MLLRLSRKRSAAIYAREIGAFVGPLQSLTACCAAVTLLLFYGAGTHYSSSGANQRLDRAYQLVAGAEPRSFPSQAAIEGVLAKQDPAVVLLKGAPAADYHYLRQHGGREGTLYVEHVDKTHLSLVARVHHDAIEQLNVTIPPSGPIVQKHHALYTGHLNWPLFWWFLGGEASLFSLLGVLVGLGEAGTEIGNRRRWHEIVNDDRLGPAEAEKSHVVYMPHCEDAGDSVLMTLKQLTWSAPDEGRHEWRAQPLAGYEYVPLGLERVSVKRDSGVAAVSGRWFEFCAQVAEVNANLWQETLRMREQEAEQKRLELERKRLIQEKLVTAAAEEEQREKMVSILQPGGVLMRQALDARPLAIED